MERNIQPAPEKKSDDSHVIALAEAGGCGGLGVEFEFAGPAERETNEGFFSRNEYS